MRRPSTTFLPAAVVALLAAVGSAAGQDGGLQTKHWPRHDISFPIDVTAFEALSPRPVSIRFSAATPDRPFRLVANKKPAELDKILDKQDPNAVPRRGFTYTAAGDGVEEFAVQYEYADGQLAPAKPSPQFRIHFDATVPVVKATATGPNGIRWQADDANLVPGSVRIEGRYVGLGDKPFEILNTGELKADDSFTWKIPATRTMEVVVVARDRAGNNGRSKVIRLGAGADRADADPKKPGSFGDPIVRDPARTGSGFGGIDEFPSNRPKIDYKSTNKLTVKSKVTHVTRSGVESAQLFVQNESTEWRAAGKKDGLNFTADTPDPTVEIPFDAPRDGLYGFIIQPISRAGTKADDPRPGDVAQYLVEVDTTKPEMTLKNVRVGGGGLNGPLVEIEWQASDKNLHVEPITLEFSDDDKKTWKPISGTKLTNTGKYTWEITDKKLWRFHVRGQATDMAGNSAFDETKQPVLVDLDKPSGTVEKVNDGGPPTTPRRQVQHTEPGIEPGKLAVTPAAAPAAQPKPPSVGGRIGAPPEPKKPDPHKPEPKKEDPKKIDTPLPAVIPPPPPAAEPMPKPLEIPPPKVEPMPTLPVPPPTPPGGVVPVPDLPPLPVEKK